MATFKLMAIATPDAASNTSLTSAFPVPGEVSHFMIQIPPGTSWCATTTCGINVLGGESSTGSFYDVAYSNNPATSTSGHAVWSTAGSAAVSGAAIICEALQFVPGFAKLRFLQTVTAATGFKIYARKFD